MTYMTVFYHRAFTHRAIVLSPWLEKFVIHSSSWITGLDLKSWVCMHRMHHAFVDTDQDPHSPLFHGVFGTFLKQHESFQKTILGLLGKRKRYTAFVKDLSFDVHWLNQYRGLWLLPLFLHLVTALSLGFYFHVPLLGLCYFAGMLSHPIQGWLVNSICHRFGYRNFDTKDYSTNNTLVGLLLLGEGYHNNHHFEEASAKFSRKWFEFDLGYLIIRILQVLGWARINTKSVKLRNPMPEAVVEPSPMIFPDEEFKFPEVTP